MRTILGVTLTVYIGMILLLNIPFIQQRLSVVVSSELSKVLGSQLTISHIDMGLLNRIIVSDILLYDQSGKEMLKVSRLSAKYDIIPLFKGKISIGTVQLFGFDINIEKEHPDAVPNIRFLIDAFASKDTVGTHSNLDIRVNSLLIRRGKVSYNVLSEKESPGKFNPNHVNVQNIIANVSLKALQNDSVNASIKRMSADETNSGFQLKKLSLKIVGNRRGMNVENFAIELPRTELKADTIYLSYDSLDAFSRFADKVRFSFRLLPSRVTLKDLSPFIPVFAQADESLWINMSAHGMLDDLECSRLAVYSSGHHFLLAGDLSLQNLSSPNDALLFGQVTNLRADQTGMAFLLRNLKGKDARIPASLRNIGYISFQGQMSGYFTDLVMYGAFHTGLGTVSTDLKFSSDRDKGLFAYSGRVKTADFELGKMFENRKLDKVSFDLSVVGQQKKGNYPDVKMKGDVLSLDYSDYCYKNIELDGEYKEGGFDGKLFLNDEHGTLMMNGNINLAEAVPTFNFKASIDHFRPHKLHITQQDMELSARINADFAGKSIDDINGKIYVDSLVLVTDDGKRLTDNFRVVANRIDSLRRKLIVSSGFMTAVIEGNYSYRTLPKSILNVVAKYVPSLVRPDENEGKTNNNFSFDVNLYDTDFLSAALKMPFHIYTHSTLKGYFNDRAQRLRIEGYFPRLLYDDKFFESGMVLCENHNDLFHARLRFTHRKPQGAVSVAIDSKAKNDSISTVLNWGNDQTVTYSGQLSTLAYFLRPQVEGSGPDENVRKGKVLKTVVRINPTDVIVNDTLWKIRSSTVLVDAGKVFIDNFNFSHGSRHLTVNGTLSKNPEDTLLVNLQDINIGYVFDIANVGVRFQGEATGPAYASGVLGKPVLYTDLHIRNLGLNDGLLGDAKIHGEWHHDVKGIKLDADIREGNVAHTYVNGYIYPIKPQSSLDLHINAKNTNLKFIHYYMRNITSDFDGRVNGRVRLYGKFKELTMEGKVDSDARLKIDVLNTTLAVKDSILIEPQGLVFSNNRIYDTEGHQGLLSGTLRYEHFKRIRYQFQAVVDDMLVMNTKESPDYPFYGTVYGTGSVSLQGNAQDGLNVDVAMTTGANTSFTYVKDYVGSAASSQFVRFVDKTPRRAAPDSIYLSAYERARQQMVEEEEENKADIRLNLLVDVTPDAAMKIIMDPVAGDYISGWGEGNIRTEFYNKGDVKMYGNYRITRGMYKFSLQEVIRKDFNISDGSTISFNGSPLDATLDIQASYTVSSASLADLIPDISSYDVQNNVKVNCLMKLSGQLTAPEIQLGLELPNERDEVQALVRNYIPTDEQMNMQILYLLSIGKFYTEMPGATQNSDMMSSVLSSTLSGQLNNALSRIINNNNWNIGTNLSTGQDGWTDMEFEGVLSGQLLNNRLLINGNFGYRDNPMANTNFVGDFDAEWLVNRSGDIRLKAYNETNDRYYTKTNLTTQGIGIVFKKDFNKWRELFFWNNLFRKRRNARNSAEIQPTDSVALPLPADSIFPLRKP